MAAKKWDLTKGSLTINGVPILGFKKGDFITAQYNDPRTTTHMSADNVGRHSQTTNKDGTVGIGLIEASLATSTIQAFVDTGEPLEIAYEDFTSPGAYVLAINSLLQDDPPFVRSQEVNDVDWVFTSTDLDYKHASPAQQ